MDQFLELLRAGAQIQSVCCMLKGLEPQQQWVLPVLLYLADILVQRDKDINLPTALYWIMQGRAWLELNPLAYLEFELDMKKRLIPPRFFLMYDA